MQVRLLNVRFGKGGAEAPRVRPLGTGTGGIPGLSLSINDDDPVTFATRLSDEFAYLHAALLNDGVAPEAALLWIDEAREAGLRSRFTGKASGERRLQQRFTGRREH